METFLQRVQAVADDIQRWNKGANYSEEHEDRDECQIGLQDEGETQADTILPAEQLEVVTTPELEMIQTRNCPPGLSMDQREIQESEGMSDDGSICSTESLRITEVDCLLSTEENVPLGKRDDDFEVKCAGENTYVQDDVAKYMEKRQMTPMQERMNALTMIPTFVYCFFFLLSGAWLDQSLVEEVQNEMITGALIEDVNSCISSSLFPNLHALPPLAVITAGAGVIVHAPFSFIYHWFYAHRLPPGFARTDHWSRRMDQAMIHVISACMAYSTSGRFDFFAVNALYNIDCIYRQFKRQVRPQRNQIRIYISVLAYLIPILRRGDFELLFHVLTILGLSTFFFAKYPIGGWSHSVFHLIIAGVPPLLMTAATKLPVSQHQMDVAAQCAAFASATSPQ